MQFLGAFSDWLTRSVSALSTAELAVLVATVVTCALLIAGLRRYVPRLTNRALGRLDRLVPADLSGCSKLLVRVVFWLLTAVVVATAGLIVATLLAVDTSGVLMMLRGWGARVWTWLITRALRIALLIALTVVALRIIRGQLPNVVGGYLTHRSRHKDKVSAEAEKRRATLSEVAVTVASWTVTSVAIIVGLSELGMDIGPILAGAGVLGLAVGFGAQNLVRDFFAGVFILLEDQYRIGDIVEVAGKAGIVEEMNLRRTVLRDLDNIAHHVPNGEIKIASNFTKNVSRVHFNIEVAYKEDLDRCIEVINRVGQQMFDDRFGDGAMLQPIQVLRVDGFNDSGVAIKVLGDTQPSRQWGVAGEFRRRLKRAFDEHGIEIPFPHRTLYWGVGEQPAVSIRSDSMRRNGHSQPALASPKHRADDDEEARDA